MKIKWRPLQIFISLGVFLLLFSTVVPSVGAFTVQQTQSNEDNVSVNIKQIDKLSDVFSHTFAQPTNTLEQTLVSVLSKDEIGDYGNFTVNATAQEVLRYTYPNYSDEQLKAVTINAQQAINWLHHMGYTATLVNRALTTEEIKTALDDSSPIIPIFINQNKTDWLNACLSGVLYAHDDVVAGDEKLNKSFVTAIGYGEAMIQDGQETQPITFSNQSESADPLQASDSYLWTQTITNIKQDPAASNAQTINTNVKNGIFEAKSTQVGTSSQVEFTDPLINNLKTKVVDIPQPIYSSQVQTKGWLPECKYNEPSGTMGESLRLEAFKIALPKLPAGLTGGIAYSAHVQSIGWQAEQANGAVAGTVGKALRVEAIKVRLTGAIANEYSVYYATYVQGTGWTEYSKDNAISGTTGKGLRVEAISIRILKKKLPKAPSKETKKAAVALVNAYEDVEHQKSTTDLEQFLGVSPNDAVSSKQIMDWYHFLGLEFDVKEGRFTKEQAIKVNQSGRLYFTILKAKSAPDNIQNFGAIGLGYMENTSGFTPELSYVNEDYTPSYYWKQRGNETFEQMLQRMKTYDYDNIYTNDEQGKTVSEYQEEVTLYNIRAKESEDKVDITTPTSPEQGETTAPQPTGANYRPLTNFITAGTQGDEPWCSEYVAASAINMLNKVTAETPLASRVTAQQVMQAYHPTATEEELKTMPGGTIENSLKALKDKYQVTADVENRALSFNEVKKELDSGNLVQMDLYDKDEQAPQGSADNAGHSVAIVGYVLPADGDTNKAPYYQVWNPWWGQTFYVSSQSDTMRLGGVNYQWSRTWHNWRKTTSTSSVNLDSAIADQKVASASHPSFRPVYSTPTPFKPLGENISHQMVAQFGKPDSMTDIFTSGVTYWYAYSTDNTRIMVGINNAATSGQNRQNNGVGQFVTDYKQLVSDGKSLARSGFTSLSGAYISAMATLSSGALGQSAIKALSKLMALVGISFGAEELASDIKAYRKDISNLKNDFVMACNEAVGK